VQIAFLGGAVLDLLATGRPRRVATAGRQRLEDRIEVLHRRGGAADHQAVAALEAPDAAAGPDVHVLDALGRQLLGAADVIDVVRIAAVDQDVTVAEQRHEIGDDAIDDAGRRHEPDGSRRGQLADEVREGGGAAGLAAGLLADARLRLSDDVGATVVDDELVPGLREPDHHVLPHAAQTDHPQLHGNAPFLDCRHTRRLPPLGSGRTVSCSRGYYTADEPASKPKFREARRLVLTRRGGESRVLADWRTTWTSASSSSISTLPCTRPPWAATRCRRPSAPSPA
jgi:hypothetical protein